VYAVEQADESMMLQNFEIKENDKIAIIVGNEVDGVDDEAIHASDGCIEIPQYGTKHSLNVSIATGIVIWDVFTKMNVYVNYLKQLNISIILMIKKMLTK
jgi:tRNA G18 (ribose-2'-O)-methylase SpoU